MGNRVLLRRLTPYGVSLLTVGVATALTLAFWKFIQPLPYPFYFLAVIVAALSGGLRLGLTGVYAAPSPVHHYPDEFIAAVPVWDESAASPGGADHCHCSGPEECDDGEKTQ